MRPASAVAVTCGGGLGWRLVQALLPALAVGALAAWGLLWAESAVAPALPLALASAGLAWRLARPRAQGLRWDGQAWRLDDTPGSLAVMIDLGPFLLLRLRPEAGGRPRWAAVTSAEAGAAWHALRAAVYSRPPMPSPRVLPPERAAD